MNQTEFKKKMAETTELTQVQSLMAIEAFKDLITEALSVGDTVALQNFGTFETAKRSARTGIHPQTKKEIYIESKIAPKFRASKALKENVNK